MSADFTPTMGTYIGLKPFRFWCQKVLPLVYDDSLSYYELLNKVVDYLNKTMEDVETLHEDVDDLHDAYVQLQNYVNNYFDNLDVQEEINNKLDEMAEDGSLSALIQPLFDTYKTQIDSTVNQQNERITNIYQEISVLDSRMDSFASLPDGSTAGDAELEDIRVGADGSVFASAGDAVRGQIVEDRSIINGLLDNFENIIPITYSIYNNRIKVLSAFYTVVNGYLNRVLFIKLNSSLNSANTWTIGTLSPYAIYNNNGGHIQFNAVSMNGDDISDLHFKQNLLTINNFEVITDDAVSAGHGGVIMLTYSEPMNDPTKSLTDSEESVELFLNTNNSKDIFNQDFVTESYGWNISAGQLQTLTGYSYVMLRVLSNSSIAVKGLSETLNAFGYAVLDSSHNVVLSGGEKPGDIIDIPYNGYWIVYTFPSNDDIELVPFFKEKVVVLGDSWSDNNPEHTEYTKWTDLLNNDGRYEVKVYAQNGSTISGDTPDYGLNGNVAGQLEEFFEDDIDNVDTVIIFGGINDFRSSVAQSTVYNKIASFYSSIKTRYPKARLIYLANNQVFITKEQLDYFHSIVDYLRTNVGMESYVTFGWVNASHYIADNVHVDNYGYKDLYANIISILNGGCIDTVVSHLNATNNNTELDLYEEWVNGLPKYSAKCDVDESALGESAVFNISTSGGKLLSSVPFVKQLYKFNPSGANYKVGVIKCSVAETFNTSYKLNTSNSFTIYNPNENDGIYMSENYN